MTTTLLDDAIADGDDLLDGEASIVGLWLVAGNPAGESLGLFVGHHEVFNGIVEHEQERLTFSPQMKSIPPGVDVESPLTTVIVEGTEYRIISRTYEPEPALRVHLGLAL